MQIETPRKADSAKHTGAQTHAKDTVLRDELMQDELMQELAQQKMSLENFAREDINDDNRVFEPAVFESTVFEPTKAPANILRDCVEHTLHNYFTHLDGQSVTNVYDMVLTEVEAPLLEVVMRYAQYNQCKAAELLGLSRGTLRKKLQQYGLL